MASVQHLTQSLNLSSPFCIRHILFGVLSVPIIISFSILNHGQIKIISILGNSHIHFTNIFYSNRWRLKIKGAQRWLYIGNIASASEVCKPFFIIFNAWVLSLWAEKEDFPGWIWSIASIALFSALLLLQPDLGTSYPIYICLGFSAIYYRNSSYNYYFFNNSTNFHDYFIS